MTVKYDFSESWVDPAATWIPDPQQSNLTVNTCKDKTSGAVIRAYAGAPGYVENTCIQGMAITINEYWWDKLQ